MTDSNFHDPKHTDQKQNFHVSKGPVRTQEDYAPPEPPCQLTQPITTLIDTYVSNLQATKSRYTPIHVDEIALRIAKFYELIRKVIDWKEDNVLRRAAIERILKRLLFSKVAGFMLVSRMDTLTIGETITVELIRGGHLPNDEIPREYIPVVAKVLSKYMYFLKHPPPALNESLNLKRKFNFFTFIIEIAACEIEETLTSPVKENGLLRAMTELIYERMRIIPKDGISDDKLKTQIFISACRTLYDLDDAFITYHLLRLQFPQWQNPSKSFIESISKEMVVIWKEIDSTLHYSLSKDLYNICERVDTVFMLLDDFLEHHKKNPAKIKSLLKNKSQFTKHVKEFYNKRYTTLKTRLFRLGVFSTLSVFLSNWFTFYLVEVPMAKLFYEGFNLFTAIIDFLLPTAVMFLLVIIIKPPAEKNINHVLSAIYDFVYKDGKGNLYEVHLKKRRRSFFTLLLGVIYLIITVLIFSSVAFVFYIAGLPITSVIFDTLTIALTIFAAVTIRNKSKELVVYEKTTFREFLLDMFSVPVAKVGSLLAAKWKEYNVISIFFNFIIETPFVLIVEFIENWSEFLKERRAEIH